MISLLSIAERTLQRAYTVLIRNRVFSFAIPIVLGVVATAIVASLALGEVDALSNQVKGGVATEMQVSSARLSAYAEDQYDQLIKTSLTGRQDNEGSDADKFSNEIWDYDATKNSLRSRINGKFIYLDQQLAASQKIDPSLAYEREIAAHMHSLKLSVAGSTPTSIRSLRNATIDTTETAIVLSVPNLGPKGELKGIVTCMVPASKFLAVLSSDGLAIADIGQGRAMLGVTGDVGSSLAPFIRKGEPLIDEFYSTTATLDLPGLNKNFIIWSVYYKDQFLVLPGMRRVTTVYSTAAISIWVLVFLGITGLHRAKNRQKKLLDSLVRSNNELIFIVNKDFEVESAIGKMTSQLGWKPEEYSNVDFRLFIHEKDRAEFDRLGTDNLDADENDNTVEVRIEKRDGEYQWYQLSKSDMTHVPEILGWVVTATNIEQRKRATEHIIAAKRAAEKANEAKSEFLSRMSHELRTPLNAILGFGQLLEMGDLEHRQKQNVDQILNAGRHLLNLVNDILDIARIETRKVNLSMEQV
ncbi:MAG TPA: histidine kinase dimerization/phospho-acceptor domain-containing protein, partial [Fimbriimonas sp.]|nr:histidine kinase dimerization/phospho-acceptor domain-containing protein [Fimbriimonas sp.]